MTKCTIKKADFSELAALHNRIPEFAPETAGFFAARCAETPYLALIATMNGQPAGYSLSYDRYHDGSLYCWMAGILPDFRKKGIYSALADYRENWAQDQGFTALRIKTRNNRREMLHWLVKNGFLFTKVDKREPMSDSRIELTKHLPGKNHE